MTKDEILNALVEADTEFATITVVGEDVFKLARGRSTLRAMYDKLKKTNTDTTEAVK